MKTTATLFDILEAHYIRCCKNEFTNVRRTRITFYDDDTFLKKLVKLEPEEEALVNNVLFPGCALKEPAADHAFKKTFISRFIYHEIGVQTEDLFRARLISTFSEVEDGLNAYYEMKDKALAGVSESDEKGGEERESTSRDLMSSLPQSEVNLSLDDPDMDYGDQNNMGKRREKTKRDGNSTSRRYSVGDLMTFLDESYLDKVMGYFEKKCFLNVW